MIVENCACGVHLGDTDKRSKNYEIKLALKTILFLFKYADSSWLCFCYWQSLEAKTEIEIKTQKPKLIIFDLDAMQIDCVTILLCFFLLSILSVRCSLALFHSLRCNVA